MGKHEERKIKGKEMERFIKERKNGEIYYYKEKMGYT